MCLSEVIYSCYTSRFLHSVTWLFILYYLHKPQVAGQLLVNFASICVILVWHTCSPSSLTSFTQVLCVCTLSLHSEDYERKNYKLTGWSFPIRQKTSGTARAWLNLLDYLQDQPGNSTDPVDPLLSFLIPKESKLNGVKRGLFIVWYKRYNY